MGSRLAYPLLVAAILIAAVAVRIWDPAPVLLARLVTFDNFQRLSPRTYDPDAPVRIVDIDEASLARIGQWPWPRHVLADLVSRLTDLGAATVGLDFVLPEPERNAADDLAARFPDDAAVRELLGRVKALPSGDDALSRSVANGAIVMGVMGVASGGRNGLPAKASFAHAGDDPTLFVPTFDGVLSSVLSVHSQAAGAGALNWLPEHDQIVRKVPLILNLGGALYPSLATEVVRVAQGASTVLVRASNSSHDVAFGSRTGISRLRVGDLELPTDDTGQIWLHFTPHDSRRFISAMDVLESRVPAAEVEGRIIVIGSSAAGLLDLRATPLEAAMAGVEVQAQAVEQIILGQSLLRPDYADGAELAVLIVAGLLLSLIVHGAGAGPGALAGGLVTAGVVAASWQAFSQWGFLLDPSYPVATLTLLYISGTAFSYFNTERERNRVRQVFSHYMASSLIEQLIREPERLKLGGETRELTLLFSDVRGFTSIAETYKTNPQGLTELMNQLLTPLSLAIIERNGVIDKYIGDAIMAFWNAPIDDPDHPKNACSAALEMQARLNALNEQRRRHAEENGIAFQPIILGIGMSTGEGVVGNMGSEMRFDYSALGDVVNLASRLESLTAHYGVPILATANTIERGAAGLAAIEIDMVQVKGRSTPERVFALFGGEKMAREAAFVSLRNAMAQFLLHYRAGRWPEARAQLDMLHKRDETGQMTQTLRVYDERLTHLSSNPADANWHGVWRMEQK